MKPSHEFIARMSQSFALSTLAASITYFSYAIMEVKDDVPALMSAVESLNTKGDILAVNVPRLLDKLDSGTESINTLSGSISDARKTAQEFQTIAHAFNYEVSQYRTNTIPSMETTIKGLTDAHSEMNTTISTTSEQIPAMLKSVDAFDTTLNRGITAMYAVQPSVDSLTVQMDKVRQEFPVMVGDAKEVVDAANRVGSKTSEGVVDGIIKGVITSPVTVLKGAGESLSELLGIDRRLSEHEQKEIWKTIETAVISSDVVRWESDRSKNSAIIEPGKAYERYDRNCRLVNLTLKFANEETSTQTHEICEVNGQWVRITKK